MRSMRKYALNWHLCAVACLVAQKTLSTYMATAGPEPRRGFGKPYFVRTTPNSGFIPPAYLLDCSTDGVDPAEITMDGQFSADPRATLEDLSVPDSSRWPNAVRAFDPNYRCQLTPPAVVKTIAQRREEFTPEQLQVADTLRKELEKHDASHWFDDWALLRFCVARGFQHDEALKMMLKHAEWRQEFKPETKRCTMCEKNPNAHFMQFVGWDLHQQPVTLSCFRWAFDRSDPNTNGEHCVELINHMISLMPVGVEKWVIITDFTGFSYRQDSGTSVAKMFVDLLQNQYPERLAMKIFLDPPTMFWVAWGVMKTFIDPKTVAKVKMVYTAAKPNVKDAFPEWFPPHVCEYLFQAIENNRATGAKR